MFISFLLRATVPGLYNTSLISSGASSDNQKVIGFRKGLGFAVASPIWVTSKNPEISTVSGFCVYWNYIFKNEFVRHL
jgi:hypothetical protein